MTDISYYLELPYTKVLRRDEEGDIVATIAELDGCMAHGGDESEALNNLRAAQTAWIDAALTAGLDIPAPELEEDLPSGKFVVRLPRSLHRKLNKLAKKDDVSLNQVMVVAATDYVARNEIQREHAMGIADPSAWHHMKGQRWEGRYNAPGLFRDGAFLRRVRRTRVLSESEEPQHVHSRGRK